MGQVKPGVDFKRRLSRPELPGISAIFNPRKLRRNSTAVTQLIQGDSSQRAPSVVVTEDNLSDQLDFGDSFDQDRERLAFGGMSNGPPGSTMNLSGDGPGMSRMVNVRGHGGSAGSGTSASSVPLLADVQAQSGNNAIVSLETSLIQSTNQTNPPGAGSAVNPNANLKPIAKTFATIRKAVFSKTARKLCCGLFLSLLVGCCWTAMIHAVKRAYITTYIFQIEEGHPTELHPMGSSTDQSHEHNGSLSNGGLITTPPLSLNVYDAPFFTAWLLSIATVFFYPLHQLTVFCCSCMGRKGPKTMSRAISDAVQGFRERGMTLFQFLARCAVLCLLWLLTNFLLVASLRVLRATEVLALFATTTSFVYLLSWVVLHQQFVGLRIFAVILSNMGIALLAYMDGQSHKSPTVGYVILGAAAAGASAVFKVSLKKSFGFGATVSQQVALIFSVVGLLAALILWPIFVTLYFTGMEVIRWPFVPWELIFLAIVCSLLVTMLDNFGVTCTFEFFITIGLLMAIPFSAVVDISTYGESFQDMRLAGIITVGIGFCVVLLPENWPDYITRLIRRFHPPEEEEVLAFRGHSAMPRLSRAGLEHHMVHPPNHSNPSSAHHQTFPMHHSNSNNAGQSTPNHYKRQSNASFNPPQSNTYNYHY